MLNYLNTKLKYDPLPGQFTWISPTSRRVKVGDIAGVERDDGYIRIKVNNVNYYAHRLAWLFTYGNWPSINIDHINGDPSDNRVSNLRECNQTENNQNKIKQTNNSSGYTGVYYHKGAKKWMSYISINGKRKHLGLFDDLLAASEAYLKTKLEIHKFNPIPR